MAEPALKLAPKSEAAATLPAPEAVAKPRPRRKRLRLILLMVLPLVAAGAGLTVYLAGGRFISTDDAYVGAQKVLITPDVAGKIIRVAVREGEHVKPGDELFAIDPLPYQLAADQAQARLAAVETEVANLKTNLHAFDDLVALAKRNVELKQRDVERKTMLMANRAASQADVDTAAAGLVMAQNQLTQLTQQQANVRNQLLGDPDLPIARYPAYAQAQGALDAAKWNLAHTVLYAPIAGMATQVDSIQLGRFLAAGTPVFSIMDDVTPWVDANPKETDITYLRLGQKVSISIDTFPNRTFHGTVASVSPGTAAQFAILPAQNASGNWVKVVQRVPLRIRFDPGQDLKFLRAGMSANVEIDSGHTRTLRGVIASLLGTPTEAVQEAAR
jgi:membrane fusion protein (multidrug efflux system)